MFLSKISFIIFEFYAILVPINKGIENFKL